MSILVTSPCPKNTFKELGIKNWPIQTCDKGYFKWTYEDKETCLLIASEVIVTTERGKPVKFGPGDLVKFTAEIESIWGVQKSVQKHYQFGDQVVI